MTALNVVKMKIGFLPLHEREPKIEMQISEPYCILLTVPTKTSREGADEERHTFVTGDVVEVGDGDLANLKGTVLSIDGNKITIMPKHDDLKVQSMKSVICYGSSFSSTWYMYVHKVSSWEFFLIRQPLGFCVVIFVIYIHDSIYHPPSNKHSMNS